MFSSKLNFRIAAFAGALSIFSLGCGRQDKKDIGAIQTVPYAEAMKKCPDKIRQAEIFTMHYSTNNFVPLILPAIKITNGDLLFTEDALCVPVKQEAKVIPTASAIASAPAPSVSAPIPVAPASVAKTAPSATKGAGPAPSITTTKGGLRPQ